MSFMEGPGHAAFCGNDGPHEKHRHPLPDSYEVCSGNPVPANGTVTVPTPPLVDIIAEALAGHWDARVGLDAALR